jgi:murein DD-endopeptidase MepM/ murein hydrolase activator NlpD
MRLKRAPLGALMFAAMGLLSVTALAAPAVADDPTPPRAAPVPRGAARAASVAPSAALGYDALEKYAFDVAADLTSLDQATSAVATQMAYAQAQLEDLRTAMQFSDPTARAALRQRIADLKAQAGDLIAAGALRTQRPERIWASPAQGEITQPFGPTRLRLEPAVTYNGVSYAHFHNGLDIGAPWDAPVVAAAPGKVAFAGRMNDGDWIVLIAHADNFVTMYAHLDPRLAVSAGDYVTMGQQIGNVGSTGISTGPHLHFTVWHDGSLVDPMTRFHL